MLKGLRRNYPDPELRCHLMVHEAAYNSLVKPQLEYASPVLAPHKKV